MDTTYYTSQEFITSIKDALLELDYDLCLSSRNLHRRDDQLLMELAIRLKDVDNVLGELNNVRKNT